MQYNAINKYSLQESSIGTAATTLAVGYSCR